MSRRISASKSTRRDGIFTAANAISKLNIPVVSQLPDVNTNQTGNIVFNRADNIFYGFVNGEWEPISNADIEARLLAIEIELGINIQNTNGYGGNQSLIINTQSTLTQSIAAQTTNTNNLLTQLQNTVINLQNEFAIYRNAIQNLISETPVTRSLILRAQPDVLSIVRFSQPEIKIVQESFFFIETISLDWSPLTPATLSSAVDWIFPYDDEETMTSFFAETQFIPSTLAIPVTYGFYSGTRADWDALPVTTTEQDLIDAGDLTGVINVSPIYSTLRRTGAILDATGVAEVGNQELDVTLYDDDSNILQTIVEYGITALNAALGAAGVPFSASPFSWNGATYETNLFTSVLTNLEQAYDPDVLNSQLLAENASDPPFYGNLLQLQGPLDTQTWAGFNFCGFFKGNQDNISFEGFKTPNYPEPPPPFPTIGNSASGQEIVDFASQWTLDTGFETFVSLTLLEWQANARWRTAVANEVIPWASSYLGQRWGENSIPGFAVYDTVITFSRDGVALDGGSITGANYVAIGGFPYAFFDAAASPGPASWIERQTEIENFGFQ